MDLVQFVHMVVTAMIGIGMFILGIKQFRLQRDVRSIESTAKWYDKRLSIFNAIMGFIADILGSNELTDIKLIQFARDTKEKEFLFDDDIQQLINNIYKQGCRFAACTESLKVHQDDAEIKRLLDEKYEFLKWLVERFDEVKRRFGKYLKIV